MMGTIKVPQHHCLDHARFRSQIANKRQVQIKGLIRLPCSESLHIPTAEEMRHDRGRRALADAKARMNAARTSFTSSRTRLREAVATCYAVAQFLMRDDAAWEEFAAQVFWDGYRGRPTQQNRDEALRHVLIRANGKGKNSSKVASRLFLAVKPFWDDGIPARRIPDMVKKGGGFSKLVKAQRRHKGSRQKPIASPSIEVDGPGKGGQAAVLSSMERTVVISQKAATDKSGNGAGERPVHVRLEALLVGQGREFLRMPIGSDVQVVLRICRTTGGEFSIEIKEAAPLRKDSEFPAE